LNSVAGGGSFLTFPALVFIGVPPISANTTNTAALWPGAAASAFVYRHDVAVPRRILIFFSFISVLGGLIGAIFLVNTPETKFARLIPYLLAVATLLFALSDRIGRWMRVGAPAPGAATRVALGIMAVMQLLISIYGGYFGGGIGILMLGVLGLTGMKSVHAMNAVKTLLSAVINGVAVIVFIAARNIVWPDAAVMTAGAVIGGYSGARLARNVRPDLVRLFVIIVGLVMTAYFIVRG